MSAAARRAAKPGAHPVERQRLHPIIERVVPFEQDPEELKLMESGSVVGKILLRR